MSDFTLELGAHAVDKATNYVNQQWYASSTHFSDKQGESVTISSYA